MRRLLTVAVLVAGLALSITACSTSSSNSGTAATDLIQTVARSADAINTMPSHQTVTTTTPVGDLTVDGDADPTTKSASVRISGPAISEVRTIGNDAWVAVAGEAKPWAHLDVSKLPDGSPTRSTLDLRSNFAVLSGITSAKLTSPGTYECVADLTKAKSAMTGGEAEKANVQAIIDLAGPAAGALPFRATLDDRNRLVQLSYDVTSTRAGKLSFKAVISNYGKPFTVVKPSAGDVMEGTPDMYDRY